MEAQRTEPQTNPAAKAGRLAREEYAVAMIKEYHGLFSCAVENLLTRRTSRAWLTV
jgi:hypothetical protein